MQKDTSLQKNSTIRAIVEAYKTTNEEVLKRHYFENDKKVERYILRNSGSKEQAKA